jgi:TIR domain
VIKRVTRHVFVSHSSKDKRVADIVRAELEAQFFPCWIAPRDIPAGMDWDQAILNAVDRAGLVVLILSTHANSSRMVKLELTQAASKNIPIIPLRIEDVQPGRELQLFLAASQWLDAFPPPAEAHLDKLVDAVRHLLTGKKSKRGVDVVPYMITRGPDAHRAFTERPGEPWHDPARGAVTVKALRTRLLAQNIQLERPQPIKVRGTLFPCALLSSGWWDRHSDYKVRQLKWKDGLQKWLFYGFDQWGPSWDFTWDFENWNQSRKRRYFIAQLGDGDEANSLPILVPGSKAQQLQGEFRHTWGGVEAEIRGVLGHRKHFAKYVDAGALELFGGLLDYCLWLADDNSRHVIELRQEHTDSYSGYLWKCVAPAEVLAKGPPSLNEVFFLWEHVDFASDDALKYCLEALAHKEEHVRRRYGELVLVQKSSALVAGTPTLSAESVYGMLVGKSGTTI